MKKKILALCLVIVLVATAITGVTLAYFTDVDQNTNEFGVAGLKIDLYEKVMHKDAANKIKGFGPLTISGENAKYVYETEDTLTLGKGDDTNPNFHYKDIMPGDKMTKIVTVENKENYGAYVALAVQHLNYHDFNAKIDGYYEAENKNFTTEELNELLGETGKTEAELMQKITDDIWSGEGWKLSYDKATNGYDIRYYPKHVVADQKGEGNYVGVNEVQLIAIDYNVMQRDEAGNPTYSAGYKNNMMGSHGYTAYDQATDDSRTWIYYLYLPAKTSYTLDLSVTCPTYVTTENVEAFAMEIDVQAAAIQVDGFATAKDAFTELNKTYDMAF